MFANFLRGPSADTLTLEVIGLVKSRDTFKGGYQNAIGSETAKSYVRKIDRLMRENGKTIDPEVSGFLRDARQHLDWLGRMQSSVGTGKYTHGPYMTTQDIKPAPAWEARYQRFQTELDTRATKLFDERYLAEARQRHDDTRPDQRARVEKKHLDVQLARKMGRF